MSALVAAWLVSSVVQPAPNQDTFARASYVAVALVGARRMLSSQPHPTDWVGVAIYASASGAPLLVGFTSDREEVELRLSFVEARLDRNPKRLRRSGSELTELWGMEEEETAESVAALNRLSRQVGLSAALALSGSFDLPALIDFDSYSAIRGGPTHYEGLESWTPAKELIEPQLVDQRAMELEVGLDQIRWLSEAMAELVTLLRGVREPKHVSLFSEAVLTEFFQNKEARARAFGSLDPMIAAFNARAGASRPSISRVSKTPCVHEVPPPDRTASGTGTTSRGTSTRSTAIRRAGEAPDSTRKRFSIWRAVRRGEPWSQALRPSPSLPRVHRLIEKKPLTGLPGSLV